MKKLILKLEKIFPKWLMWLLFSNWGLIVMNAIIVAIFATLAEFVARDPYNTISVIFFFLLLAQALFWTIIGIRNSIKDGKK